MREIDASTCEDNIKTQCVNVDVFVVTVLDTASGIQSALNVGPIYETSNSINVGKFLRQLNKSQIFNKNMAEHRS